MQTISDPVEYANSMIIVKRYHSPIHLAFNIIREETPDIEENAALQTNVRSIDDSIGLDGLVPNFLVFGALPFPGVPTDRPALSTFQCASALMKTT